VRELKNVIKRACLLAADKVITAAKLALPQVAPDETRGHEREPDRQEVEQALASAKGIVAHAARALGLSRQALYRRMEKLGVK